MKLHRILVATGAIALLVGFIISSVLLRQMRETREAYFISFWYCFIAAENDIQKNEEGHVAPCDFAGLVSQYAGNNEEEFYKKMYMNIPSFLVPPRIIYIPGDKLCESKDYPIGIFTWDRLETSMSDKKLRWVRSGKEVDLRRKPRKP